MDIIEYRFSTNAPFVQLYGPTHIAYLVFCFVVIFLFVRNRDRIRANREKLSSIFFVIIICQQIFGLYGWYFFFTDVFWAEGLPLHICRISGIMTLFYLKNHNKKLMDVIFFFSLYALSSFFYPLNVFHFGHISGVSYMINHLMTVLMPLFAFYAYDWYPDLKGWARAAVLFTVFLFIANWLNSIFGGNYFYLVERPFLKSLSETTYIILYLVVDYLGSLLVLGLLVWIKNKFLNEYKY